MQQLFSEGYVVLAEVELALGEPALKARMPGLFRTAFVVHGHTCLKDLRVKFRPDDPNKIEFKKIFDALLKSPSGVPVASFSDATGIPRMCGPFFKEDHAFSYYNAEDKYVFYSLAHFEAAKELRSEKKY